jgi:hypothetical protein
MLAIQRQTILTHIREVVGSNHGDGSVFVAGQFLG